MKKHTIALIFINIAIALSASLWASTDGFTFNGDTNSAKRVVKCPKCGEPINFGKKTRQFQNVDIEAKIASFVDDLTDEQRDQLHDLTVQSKQTLNQLRQQQRELHDTIRQLLRQPTDQSEILFPLFDKSAQVRAQIDKELYIARFNISKVLTEQQLQTLREKMAAEKKDKAPNNKYHKKKGHKKKHHKRGEGPAR
ncbi:MAG: hypothetical protein J6W45_05020 [Bacteroidales bacterium]|nr:hypothetical protein [Bacteroidales bacterium]